MNSVLDMYFEFSYDDLLNNNKKCKSILEEVLKVNIAELQVIEQGIILFMVSEFTRKHKSSKYVEMNEIEILVMSILNNWKKEKVQYISTLGCIYGGLRGINRFLKDDKISKTLKSIKEYVFMNFIEKGMLCSDSNKTATDPNMLLACVPFGMFEPEDLVFVEAVKSIKSMMDRNQLNETSKLLLGWYFVEQGTYRITRDILKDVSKDSFLYKMIFEKLEKLGEVDKKVIIHNPMGNNNIYEPGNDEIFPKIITDEDKVIIKAIAFPMSMEEEVVLECNGEIVKGKIVENKFWEYRIGPFNKGEIVEYNLYFYKDYTISEKKYSFEVVESYKVGYIYAIKQSKNRILLRENKLCVSFEIKNDGLLYIDVIRNKKVINEEDLIDNKKNIGSEEWRTIPSNKQLVLKNQKYILEVNLECFNFTYFNGQKKIIESSDSDWLKIYCAREGINKLVCRFKTENEKFYGFGERYNELNQRGESPENFVFNQYKEQGLRTYIPMPFFISNKGYGMLANTSMYTKFDMAEANKGEFSIEIEDSQCKLIVMPGSMNEVIQKNSRLSGYPEMLPKWAFGPWMSSNNWDSEYEVRKQVSITNELEIPATVLVIEAWSDEATFYIFNDAKYDEKSGDDYFEYKDFTFPKWGRWPDPKGLISHLHDNNLKCILWQIPIIKQISSLNHLQKEKDEQHFIYKGYGVLNEDMTPFRISEGWFKDSLLMDFSNEEGKKWWFDKRKYLIEDLKVDGFKTDGGEFVFGKNLKFNDGRTGREMRNEYPNDYIGAYYKFAKKNNGITFSRAGYKGANQYPAHWAGDERSTFDAFKRSILAGLSSGISGLPFWGWDLAGFSGDVPTAELFIRSTQMATFCPIMQYHAESKGEFNQDRTPWNIRDRSGDNRTVSLYRYYANIRMNLLPYIYSQGLKTSKTGLPLMKAMILAYENDPKTHEIWDQYMFGDNLMVAPIINQGNIEREIYFPEGHWTNLFMSEEIYGPIKKTIVAELDEIPIYVKENSIIPMNLNKEFEFGGRISNNLDEYNKLCFRIYGDNIKNYKFTDDLGNRVGIKVCKEELIEIQIESTVDMIYLIISEDIEKVRINKVVHNSDLLIFSEHKLKIIRVNTQENHAM